MPKPTSALVFKRLSASLARFRDDERGSISVFVLFLFVLMIMFGGIAVDVMRFEMRRVHMQQTLDRAALAAASLTQTRNPSAIVNEWFTKAGLAQDLPTVDFSPATVSAITDAGLRRVTVSASVTSYNFFMSIFSNNNSLTGPVRTEAAQGVSQIEVILALDITGSMNASIGDGRTRIQALREAADAFVNIVKTNDVRNGVSIGMVPYAAQVNVPVNLRQQFNAINVSSWDGVANAGVPFINCLEIPTSTYGQTGLSLTAPIRMAAVADTDSFTPFTLNHLNPADFGPDPRWRFCTTTPDIPATPRNEAEDNHVLLPTKDATVVRDRIARLRADGNTSIAVGMRWATALIDEAARPIYTAIGDASVQGRPADNNDAETRKIIILMTDGEHVANTHIRDAFKTGPSPIFRGSDGQYAIRYTAGGPARTNGDRPENCSGWRIARDANREFFIPHLKANAVRQRVNATEPEGAGTGALIVGACDPRAWRDEPTWTNLLPDGPDPDTLPDEQVITAVQLDWSEVWRHLRVSYVARSLYERSGVSGTGSHSTIVNMFRQTYLAVPMMDALLQQNCAAAREAGFEIYGIAFAAPAAGQAQIHGCASEPKDNYYFNATDNSNLLAAFNAIAVDISELRLTQ